MSQGVLGERIWLARGNRGIPEHHATTIRILNVAAGIGVLVMSVGLWRLEPAPTWAGMIIAMAAKLWFPDRVVCMKREMERAGLE